MLGVRGLAKSYGKVAALVGVDLEVGAGEVCGLLGPNGAGKTTLVSIVAGLRRPDAGTVVVDGVDAVANPDRARCSLGLAPQDLGVYPILSAHDNLVLFGELAGLRGATLRERIDWVADTLDLTELLARPVRTMSGGEKRRVHTAMALLHRPPLLLLDEPTTGVDVQTRSRVLVAVSRLAEDGTAVCYSTHYLPEVEALGATVAIIEQGRIIARGTVDELIRRHGGAAVELTFDGPPPSPDLSRRSEVVGDTLRIFSDTPATELAGALARLGAEGAARLVGVEVVRPSLESVFLALTGRRYDAGDASQPGEAASGSAAVPAELVPGKESDGVVAT